MGCKTNLLNLLSNLWSLITEKNFQKLVALEMLRSLCTPASHSCFFQSGRHRLGVDFLFLFGEAKRKMNESLEKKRICKSFLSCFYARRYLQLVKTGLKREIAVDCLLTALRQPFDRLRVTFRNIRTTFRNIRTTFRNIRTTQETSWSD